MNAPRSVEDVVHGFARSHRLSSRETEVLTLSAAGLHRKEVAYRLGCSPGTIDTYWRRIFRKTAGASQCEVLAALLSRAAAQEEQALEAAAAHPDALGLETPPPPLCDVLVVEDDNGTREALAENLGECGYRVATAENGREALVLLAEAPVGVVVLDLVMPVMDGWQLADSISSMPHLTRVPLLFMTAAIAATRPPPGPVFIKPFNFATLARAISLYLGPSSGRSEDVNAWPAAALAPGSPVPR